MPSDTLASLPFHEPPIATILVQSSLLICLNVVNAILDNVLYCGLVGQILLGIAWGTPGANWLSSNVERAIVQLGYLGLLLLVYEGTLAPLLSVLSLVLTNDRGLVDLVEGRESQSIDLSCRGFDRHQFAHRAVLRTQATHLRHVFAMFCCRGVAIIYESGDNVHGAWN